ncbi:MAG: glycoside hydrolase family 130 protein [Victivallales bacterium]|nr:glycoside hydrolase family 130 protein [Victivallales bacterium]
MSKLNVEYHDEMIVPGPARALLRPFYVGNQLPSRFYEPESPRTLKIIARVLAMGDEEVLRELEAVMRDFGSSRDGLAEIFEERFSMVEHLVPTGKRLRSERRLVMGAFFSSEYLFECVSLCNPSVVPAPVEDEGADCDGLRFILSLRAIGEGHISSISFREGVFGSDRSVEIPPPSLRVTEPRLMPHHSYDRSLFYRKLGELGLLDSFSKSVVAILKKDFTFDDLKMAIDSASRGTSTFSTFVKDGMLTLAQSNYEVAFKTSDDISSRVIFPLTPNQSNGMEDARFVLFEDSGEKTYYATYTAFDGRLALPQILETPDFVNFKISTLNGPMVYNKGMALFPRKINGSYAMLSRQSGENIHLMYSDHPHFWYESKTIMRPAEAWELVQIGNCGSPVETPDGWLVLTHGVGPMRKYCIGAALLDLDDPSRVIGRLAEPLILPPKVSEHNYVPNVVYTCGCLAFNGHLLVPYAVADCMTCFATVSMDELTSALKESGVKG